MLYWNGRARWPCLEVQTHFGMHVHTHTHTHTLTCTQERVERAGGQVLYWNGHRVMGVLAMSRAIGDHGLRPYVIPEPEVGMKDCLVV